MFERKYKITLFTIISLLFMNTTVPSVNAITSYEMSIGAFELIKDDDEFNLNDTSRYILTYDGDTLISMNDRTLKETFAINHTPTTNEEDYQQYLEYKKLDQLHDMRINRYTIYAGIISGVLLAGAMLYDRC